jgi:hypothetical protein
MVLDNPGYIEWNFSLEVFSFVLILTSAVLLILTLAHLTAC